MLPKRKNHEALVAYTSVKFVKQESTESIIYRVLHTYLIPFLCFVLHLQLNWIY